MNARFDLTGRWEGYYTQHDDSRPISAVFQQSGGRLAGRMHDARTEFESSISELAMREGLPPGADEQIVAKLRAALPDGQARRGPVLAESHLPADSILEGTVDGRSVRFVKTYEGAHFAGYRIGDLRIGMTVEGHSVQYHGRLSEDGSEIEGRWVIETKGDHPIGLGRSEGDFVLHRGSENEEG